MGESERWGNTIALSGRTQGTCSGMCSKARMMCMHFSPVMFSCPRVSSKSTESCSSSEVGFCSWNAKTTGAKEEQS